MNVLVCGTKDVIPRAVVYEAIEESGFEVTGIGSPGTAGVGQAAITYALEGWRARKMPYPEIFSALQRDRLEMGEWTDAIVLVGENPPETRDVVEHAERKALPIYRKELPA